MGGTDFVGRWHRKTRLAVLGLLLLQSALVYGNGNKVHGVVRLEDKAGLAQLSHAGVVVFLDGVLTPTEQRRAPKLEISQQGRSFSPRVLPLVVGTEVRFLNDDTIYHNVFSLSKAKRFDLGIYPVGTAKPVTFDRPGLVKIHCNLHPNMISNVLVLNNDLFAETDDAGRYEIANVPNGEFVLRIWGEFVHEQRRDIALTGGSVLEANFVATEAKRIVPHKNKFGMPYREKY